MAVFATRSGGLQSQASWAPPRPLPEPRSPRDQAIKVRQVSKPVNALRANTRTLVAKEIAGEVDGWIQEARSDWAVDTGFSRSEMFGEIDTRGTVIRVRMGNTARYAPFTPEAFRIVFDLGNAAMDRALAEIERNAGALSSG